MRLEVLMQPADHPEVAEEALHCCSRQVSEMADHILWRVSIL